MRCFPYLNSLLLEAQINKKKALFPFLFSEKEIGGFLVINFINYSVL
ncbi:hypothetical protein SCB49_08228 [unidentified eubacterium SCB49]|nr:hypothetical protein SCB49_08228 [unidentified eubacterium SCB49]